MIFLTVVNVSAWRWVSPAPAPKKQPLTFGVKVIWTRPAPTRTSGAAAPGGAGAQRGSLAEAARGWAPSGDTVGGGACELLPCRDRRGDDGVRAAFLVPREPPRHGRLHHHRRRQRRSHPARFARRAGPPWPRARASPLPCAARAVGNGPSGDGADWAGGGTQDAHAWHAPGAPRAVRKEGGAHGPPARDAIEVCPVSTGGRDETCPVSTPAGDAIEEVVAAAQASAYPLAHRSDSCPDQRPVWTRGRSHTLADGPHSQSFKDQNGSNGDGVSGANVSVAQQSQSLGERRRAGPGGQEHDQISLLHASFESAGSPERERRE
jgi:hypothetical protein